MMPGARRRMGAAPGPAPSAAARPAPLGPSLTDLRRRRRRALTLAGLLAGAAPVALASGLLVQDGAGARLLAAPWGAAAAVLALLAGLLLARRAGPSGRALAGCGHLPGRVLSGAALVLLADAFALAQRDRGAFALGLLGVGAWLARGAAPPVVLAGTRAHQRARAYARAPARRAGRRGAAGR